ncbi:MAG: 1-(5-phosphoribosyl)-5-[(5-phosphoribosylamino)methylideneamino]imidazole-4-carboxamide isomerase [Planctomycetes bacterium]|nr:1-(5-phosphoribosyl)-5-[(5-phosphoribosylamino)methylideneamino]imidazole-4-carboxamide isomerase [Planctomycetota bacterium]
MQILPAIDIRGGQCVRLRQGDYEQETVFGDDPAAMAGRWVEQGASFLHLVDLDGAREGRPVNAASVRAIVQAGGVACQLGGGIRSDRDVDTVLGWGVERVVIGTRALESPEWFEGLCQRFPGKIVLGIDAKDGQVATDGWLKVSSVSALDLAKRFAALPVAALVYTDIARDGMMAGPNVPAMREMAAASAWPVIASGGVTQADDVGRLAATGVAGCIIGRALYEGRIHLREIITRYCH